MTGEREMAGASGTPDSRLQAPDSGLLYDRDDVRALVDLALREDLGPDAPGAGRAFSPDLDVTARIVPERAVARGAVVARTTGVVCGLPLAVRVLALVEPRARLVLLSADGDRVSRGDVLARIEGPARGVLAAERTLLNFVQRLSGIATATRRFVDSIEGTGAGVFDTRKPPPGWRTLAKHAVRAGGGANHRVGPFDQVLVKDNHLALFGGERGIALVVRAARQAAPPGTRVEVEVVTGDGALAAQDAGADIILLDNFAPADLARATRAVRERARSRGVAAPELEASGGVTLETVRAFAEAGVDRVSVGWITHSAPALDLALDLDMVDECTA